MKIKIVDKQERTFRGELVRIAREPELTLVIDKKGGYCSFAMSEIESIRPIMKELPF